MRTRNRTSGHATAQCHSSCSCDWQTAQIERKPSDASRAVVGTRNIRDLAIRDFYTFIDTEGARIPR